MNLPLTKQCRTPGRLSELSVQIFILAQVMISRFMRVKPHVGLCADSVEPVWDSLSPSFSVPPPSLLSQNK